MASAPPAITCANHRKRERVATCSTCESPLCRDCVVHTAVGVKCRNCTGGAAATAPRASAAARHPEQAKRRRWPVLLAVLGALLILATALILVRGGGAGTSFRTANGPAAGGGGAADSEAGGSAGGAFVDRKADFTGAGGLKIGATLTVPTSVGTKAVPGVVIVPGGGAQDRNGGIQFNTGLPDPLYQDLSESFAQAGIVSLRYARRGTPESPTAQGQQMSFDDLIGDAKGALDFLAQRRETQRQPLFVLGYDQGGLAAMRLAATDPRVKGLVLLSTPGRSFVDVIANDFLRGVPDPAKGQAVADAMRTAAAQVVSTGTAPRPDTLPEELRSIFSADPPYLKGLFSLDPVAEAGKVKVPTLVVRGGNDGSILPGDVDALKAALARPDVLVPPVATNTLSLPPGQEGRFHNPSRHGTTRDGDALAAINDWVKGHATA